MADEFEDSPITTYSQSSEFGQWLDAVHSRANANRSKSTHPTRLPPLKEDPVTGEVQQGVRLPMSSHSEIREGDTTYTMAYHRGYGFAQIAAVDDTYGIVGQMDWDAKTGEVGTVMVEDQHRGMGYGKGMLRHAINLAKAHEGLAHPTPSFHMTEHGSRSVNLAMKQGLVEW